MVKEAFNFLLSRGRERREKTMQKKKEEEDGEKKNWDKHNRKKRDGWRGKKENQGRGDWDSVWTDEIAFSSGQETMSSVFSPPPLPTYALDLPLPRSIPGGAVSISFFK